MALEERWEDRIPEGWTSKDGRSLRDMSWGERQQELATNPSLRRLLPKPFKGSRAESLRWFRRTKSDPEILVLRF